MLVVVVVVVVLMPPANCPSAHSPTLPRNDNFAVVVGFFIALARLLSYVAAC